LIKRGLQVLATEGPRIFLIKLFRTAVVRIVNPWASRKHGTNSEAYWDARLRFAWDSVGGHSQTLDFALAMQQQVDLGALQEVNSVLDFGCATGDSTPVLRKMFGGSNIYLHDLSEVGVKKALAKYIEFKPIRWDGVSPVDFTYTSNVIEHVEDPLAFVNHLMGITSRHLLIQCPWDEQGEGGRLITPQAPQGEHIWTVDEGFLQRNIPLENWDWEWKLAEVPRAWPGGKQLFLLGTRKSEKGQGSLTFKS
jgi:SAM-dependent methyltransferase